jgi:hypothetical protein
MMGRALDETIEDDEHRQALESFLAGVAQPMRNR